MGANNAPKQLFSVEIPKNKNIRGKKMEGNLKKQIIGVL